MKLRRYQDAFVKTIALYLTRIRKVVAQLATGGGKTVVFAAIAHRYLKNEDNAGKTVLILVHRKELLKQTRKTCFNAFGIDCQQVIAGMKHIPKAQVYVGMVETVNRILKKHKNGHGNKKHPFGNVGILIIDEAHRLEFMKMHEYFEKCYIIGFSATPYTTSKKKPLKNYYDDIICGVDIPELISDGHLCQNITRAPKGTVDRLSLKMKGGDFDEKLMGIEFSKVKYVNNTVAKYKEFALGTKTIVFNVNISHSKEVTAAFVSSGYNCRHLDSEMSDTERDDILKWFKITPDAILCNVGIATTGFDEPTIETVIPNKSTASMPNWLQMDGRGSRVIDHEFIKNHQAEYPYPLTPKFMFTIIDMGGNAVTHGDWCQSRDWYDLFHNPLKPGKNTVAPIKVCPKCEAVIPASARVCPICEYVYPAKSIPAEVDLHDFIVITKNIDVEKVIQDNLSKKEMYPFWKIGEDLSNEAKKTVPKMTDDYFEFILTKYHEFIKILFKSINERKINPPKHKKIFSKYWQDKAREILRTELSQRYRDWQPPAMPVVNHTHTHVMSEQFRNIEALKSIHYDL